MKTYDTKNSIRVAANKELHRINDPRVEKIVKMIAVIEKSAKSLRVSEPEIRDLIQPVADALAAHGMGPTGQQAFRLKQERTPDGGSVLVTPPVARTGASQAAPVEEVKASPAVAREMGALADLSTQQLVDRMIAIGAELAARRK